MQTVGEGSMTEPGVGTYPQQKHARLRWQINECNHLLNKDKGQYYQDLVSISFTIHVNSVIKSCFANLRDLHCIRYFLSYDVSVIVANALVSSRLDYFNSLFHSLSSNNITRLQSIQNCVALFVSGASKFSHVTLCHFTGFLLNNVSSSKPWYSYISTSPLARQSNLPHICLHIDLLLQQDIAILKKYFSRFPFTALQFINLKFILTSASHMMLLNFRMICHWKFELLLHLHV